MTDKVFIAVEPKGQLFNLLFSGCECQAYYFCKHYIGPISMDKLNNFPVHHHYWLNFSSTCRAARAWGVAGNHYTQRVHM